MDIDVLLNESAGAAGPRGPLVARPAVAFSRRFVIVLPVVIHSLVAVVALPAERTQRQRLTCETVRGVSEVLTLAIVEPVVTNQPGPAVRAFDAGSECRLFQRSIPRPCVGSFAGAGSDDRKFERVFVAVREEAQEAFSLPLNLHRKRRTSA